MTLKRFWRFSDKRKLLACIFQPGFENDSEFYVILDLLFKVLGLIVIVLHS